MADATDPITNFFGAESLILAHLAAVFAPTQLLVECGQAAVSGDVDRIIAQRGAVFVRPGAWSVAYETEQGHNLAPKATKIEQDWELLILIPWRKLDQRELTTSPRAAQARIAAVAGEHLMTAIRALQGWRPSALHRPFALRGDQAEPNFEHPQRAEFSLVFSTSFVLSTN